MIKLRIKNSAKLDNIIRQTKEKDRRGDMYKRKSSFNVVKPQVSRGHEQERRDIQSTEKKATLSQGSRELSGY